MLPQQQEDEQDDSNIFDQLKSIKPFTIEQLYKLHPDVGRPPSGAITIGSSGQSANSNNVLVGHQHQHDDELYQNLVDYEQLVVKLSELKNKVRKLHKKTFDNVDKIWTLKEESVRKIGMCQQGKIAEVTFRFKKAQMNQKQLDIFGLGFNELAEVINKEYIYYSFESQVKRQKIATHLSISYQIQDVEERSIKLKIAIITLIDFIKHLGDYRLESTKTDFVAQCRRWLRSLIKRLLEDSGTTENFQFVVAHLARAPAGSANWTADLIECKPYDQMNAVFENEPKYISHCSAVLSELFYSIKSRLGKMHDESHEEDPKGDQADKEIAQNQKSNSDQNWSLIDPRFNCYEELNVNSGIGNVLSEMDLRIYCSKIPVAQIFRSYVRKCLSHDEFHPETDKNYELIMLKLLTIGTIIIKTYQIGLEAFNSIQYGTLIEDLSSQIGRTVQILSDQWSEFKRRLRGVDDALLMRLQVEYDNFMLRSILIILELRQSGIWRHLAKTDPVNPTSDNIESSVSNAWTANSLVRPTLYKLLQATGLSTSTETNSALTTSESNRDAQTGYATAPESYRTASSTSSLTYEFSIEWFKEVSEPMLWHILWQFYHNAFVSSCNYNTDNYWLDKFRENSIRYLFVNKIRDSPIGECSYLIKSITSMLLSRTRSDSKLVIFIATEIFELSFKQEATKEKVAKKGTMSLIRCAEKFPSLISLYISLMAEDEFGEDVVQLIKGCSLNGWISRDDEADIIATWLIERPIESVQNKVARLLISKMLLNNSSDFTASAPSLDLNEQAYRNQMIRSQAQNRSDTIEDHLISLKLRRRFALILYESSIRHQGEYSTEISQQSLGASIEVEFSGLFCEREPTLETNLLELSVDTSYQQFYVWCWRILFTLGLHILNQPETDWNDVKSRSGTSRSIKNTVLVNDSFHPVPSIQDSECLSLSDGINKSNPMACFTCLVLTDITWQSDTLDSCLDYLKVMANCGHLTPSLMAMKFFTICHLNELADSIAKDKRCLEYFTTIITGNFDTTRLASLIMTQISKLKQYRQLQLSQFYIEIFTEIATDIVRQTSSSWFSGDEQSLNKIACLLDHLVKFNFSTQRLEIVRKFYDCAYSIPTSNLNNGWFGSLFTTNTVAANNSSKREFLTTLHVLTQKFKRYTWLRWIVTECDSLRLEKIWEELVVYLSSNEDANLDMALKKVCPQHNAAILKSILPIHSWTKQIFDIMEIELSHPLCPLIWYNFFLNYFANSLNGVSVGAKLVPPDVQAKLLDRLDSLFDYHLFKQRNWTSASNLQQNSLAQLYKAYQLWLRDTSLRDAYVDIGRLKDDYLIPLFKAVMESSIEGPIFQYIDIQSIDTQNRNLIQVWSTATHLNGNKLIKNMIFVGSNQDESMEILTSVDDEASDAGALISKARYKASLSRNADEFLKDATKELEKPVQRADSDVYQTMDEVISLIRDNFKNVFDESSVFRSNICELDKIKTDLFELIQQLYVHKKHELTRVVSCMDGHDCLGPARIKLEVEEAFMDERKSQGLQDGRRQCKELVTEVQLLPSEKIVKSVLLIEEYVQLLADDPSRSKQAITSLLSWIGNVEIYDQLNGPYHAANHLLKSSLEILSTSQEVDTYNAMLVDLCFKHPGSVQTLSPFLCPSSCSNKCFLELYKQMNERHQQLGPMATFVMLSKFDVNSWLKINARDKQMHHELIRATCVGLRMLGQSPDESYASTFELYKRHVYLELAAPERRRPEEIAIVLEQFLGLMDGQALEPSLWLDFLTIIGLEKNMAPASASSMVSAGGSGSGGGHKTRSSNSACSSTSTPNKSMNSSIMTGTTVIHNDSSNISALIGALNNSTACAPTEVTSGNDIISDITRLSDSQALLNYHSSLNLMTIMSSFIETKANSPLNITLPELYENYIHEFGLVMTSVTFMWLRSTGDAFPDNHELIWEHFQRLWYNWIFLNKNCQNVSKTNYSAMAGNFVACINYMIAKIPDNGQLILQSTLSTLTNYVETTKEIVYLELTILQRYLKNLPWSNLLAKPNDIENLAKLSEQENYNISDLVSHILLQVDLKESMNKIGEEQSDLVVHTAERLAICIVIQSANLKGFRLHGRYFTQIPVERVGNIAALILNKMEFVNLEHSQTNKLLVNLLRLICIKLESKDPIQPFSHINDSWERSNIYANFISNYLVDLIKNHPLVLRQNEQYLYAVMDNSLQDLRLLSSPDVDITRKTSIYGYLMECCNNETLDEEARFFLAKTIIRSTLLNTKPIAVIEVFHASGQILRDGAILVYMIEKLIDLYLNMNGHYEKVLKSFSLKVLPSDIYLGACVEACKPLAMLVYFESLYKNGFEHSTEVRNDSTTPSSPSGTSSKAISMNSNIIWSSSLHWISQLGVTTKIDESTGQVLSNDLRLAIIWLKLLGMLENHLNSFVHLDKQQSEQQASNEAASGDSDGDKNSQSSQGSKQNSISGRLSLSRGGKRSSSASQQAALQLHSGHKALVEFIKQLIALYDSCNSAGLWSYIKSNRAELRVKISIIALSVACFLVDRTLICIIHDTASKKQQQQTESAATLPKHLIALKDEMLKLRKASLAKLESARKSRYYVDYVQFIETLIESINRNDRVVYSEGVQLLTTFVKTIYETDATSNDLTNLSKILPS